jgi:MFS transporter, Spinster family, sphingosine-1-phosphate transporter
MAEPRFTSYQVRVLACLALVNMVNYVDRQVIYPLFPLIARDFNLTYTQLGSLAAAFSLVHALGSLPLGWLADRVSRKKVVSYAVLFWSGATFLTGIASSFRALVAARALVGVGEAAYTPAGTAMITASFPPSLRARVQGIFDTGMFIGGAVGIALGGIIAAHWGWRSAFYVVGIPGLLLALSLFRLPEVAPTKHPPAVPVVDLLRIPGYGMVLISGWFITFASHSYIIWGSTFIQQSKGFTVEETGIILGGLSVAAGVVGVTSGAAIADRLANTIAGGRPLTVAIGVLLSCPLLVCTFQTHNRLLLLASFFAGVFFMTWYHGPVTATIHDLTPSHAHSTAMAIYYFWVNLCATLPAAWVIGKIADLYGLETGMYVAVAAQVLGGICYLGVTYVINRDGFRYMQTAGSPDPGDPSALPLRPAPSTDQPV